MDNIYKIYLNQNYRRGRDTHRRDQLRLGIQIGDISSDCMIGGGEGKKYTNAQAMMSTQNNIIITILICVVII